MTNVQIDGTWHKADDAVVKRMGEYYEAMKTLQRENEALIAAIGEYKELVRKAYDKPNKDNRTAAHYARQRLLAMVPKSKVKELELSLK